MFVSPLTSCLAALLFAVHPIHTEAVSGSSDELLSTPSLSVSFTPIPYLSFFHLTCGLLAPVTI